MLQTQKQYDQAAANFARQVSQFEKQVLEKELVTVHKKISLEALRRVMQKTPVDTGRARANWQLEVNRIPQGVVDAPGVDAPAGAPDAMKLQRELAKLTEVKPYSVIYITNNLEYILVLEDGRSKQAPHGMIRITIEELTQMFT